ncbi:MAG: type II toxin-antitoxin system VapC family toxin [Solirubrobacteraceae bacterium]|nr:type II toxin-antitoxin system VapC family toxin [Solirubrobacteraceae bacterium]
MKLLLDTHVFLWLQTDPGRLGSAVDTLASQEHELALSAASSWEIAIKHGLGRLPLPEQPASYVPSRARRSGVDLLPIEHADALAVAELPALHRDPFDRLLIAQAIRRGLTVVTADDALRAYDVPVLALTNL